MLLGSATLRAWHTCVNPGFQRVHELLVRERWSRAGAGVPGPEDERVRLHVLDDCLARATAPVPAGVLHLLADLLLGQALPLHGQRWQAPGRYTRHEPVGRVRRLMARLTRLGGHPEAGATADDQRLMKSAGIGLQRRLDLVAVHASRMHDNARDR